MPISTLRPCAQIGCPKVGREKYCPEHKRAEIEKKSLLPIRKRTRVKDPIYNTSKWQRLRIMILRRQPICCADGCNSLSTEVDHIVPLSQGGPAFKEENLQGLCLRCHSRKTLEDYRRERKKNQK